MSDESTASASRRKLLQAGVAAMAAGMAWPAVAQEKLAQNMVMYQDHPGNGQQCSGCSQFEPPNACKIVQGTILPNGWCAAFAPKT